MSGVWRKTLVYLGLVEEPDEHDDLPEHFGGGYADVGDDGRAVARPAPRPVEAPVGNVRRLPVPEPGTPHVRPTQGNVRVAVLPITAFDEVERVGERYRSGQPVLFDLRDADGAVARRILDFVSGVTYALRGRLVPAGSRCFLLVPDGVEIPLDERHRLSDMGYRVPTRD